MPGYEAWRRWDGTRFEKNAGRPQKTMVCPTPYASGTRRTNFTAGFSKSCEMTDQPVLRLFAHEAVDGYEETVRRVRSGQPAPAYETSQVRKDGARIAVSLRLSPVGGEAEGISIIARDVGRS